MPPLPPARDKPYGAPGIWRRLRGNHITAAMPENGKPHGRKPRRPPQLGHDAYRRHDVIDRSISGTKQACRIVTSLEKPVNFFAMLKLAVIQ